MKLGASAADPVPGAAQLIAFEDLGDDRFRALHNLDNYAGAAFGGQLIGQALAAAARTSDWPANNAYGHFMRAGRLGTPIDYRVERVNDGRRFATRRVLATQGDRAVFDMVCSFHAPEPGPSHQTVSIGDFPPPEEVPSLLEAIAGQTGRLKGMERIFRLPFPIELRPVDAGSLLRKPGDTRQAFWMRIPSAAEVPDGAAQQWLVGLLSDYWLPGVCSAPHAREDRIMLVTSLNHAIWFHAPARADEWLLYRVESHWAGQGRGLARGFLFRRCGTLVATVTQEALLRELQP